MGFGLVGPFIFLLVTAFSDYHIDYRYGRFGQCSESLRRLGLFSDQGESALCGPTCLANLLEKFRKTKKLRSSHLPIEKEIEILTRYVLPHIDIRNHGLQPENLSELGKLYLERISAGASVEIFRGRRAIQGMRDTLQANVGVIIEFDWWSSEDFKKKDPWSVPYLEGHFAVVAGVHKSDPSRFLLLDPWDPKNYYEVRMEEIKTVRGREYFLKWGEGRSPAMPKSAVALLRAAMKIQVP